jgi:hypothetical protein
VPRPYLVTKVVSIDVPRAVPAVSAHIGIYTTPSSHNPITRTPFRRHRNHRAYRVCLICAAVSSRGAPAYRCAYTVHRDAARPSAGHSD